MNKILPRFVVFFLISLLMGTHVKSEMEFVIQNDLDAKANEKLNAIWINLSYKYKQKGHIYFTREILEKRHLPAPGHSKKLTFKEVHPDDSALEIFSSAVFVQYRYDSSNCRIIKNVDLKVKDEAPFYEKKYEYKLSQFPLDEKRCQ